MSFLFPSKNSFHVTRTCLISDIGAGKTTLLNVLAGFK